jgi:phosphoribosylanthranilate isomerase
MLIKICGMRDEANTLAVAAAGPDMLGFIFYAGSQRNVNQGEVTALLAHLPEGIKKVAVGVGLHSAKAAEIYRMGFDYLQLHGGEDAAYCRNLQEEGISLIKAFSVGADFDFGMTGAYCGLCDYFLFDTAGAQPGGNGRSFDWSQLNDYTGETPFLLSGGLGLHNVDSALALRHPKLAGFDFNSRLELSPAMKDVEKSKLIIQKIRTYEQDKAR